MAITSITTDVPGQVGVAPRLVRVVCNDTYATITTAGYLNGEVSQGFIINPTDFIFVNYGTTNNLFGVFYPTISNGTVTMVPTQSEGGIVLPTIANHIATYTNTIGGLSEDPTTAISGGNIQAGLSGTAGTLASFPATAARGSLVVAGVANTGNTITTISNAAMGQASVISIPDPGTSTAEFVVAPAALVSGNIPTASGTAGLVADSGVASNKVLTSAIVSPDTSIDLVRFDVTCGFAALASGGSVTLYTSSGSKQYVVVNLWANLGGTNFSGGSGNRLLSITDGTTVYSLIPEADLATLVNSGWGVTALPYPASVAINTQTAAGASLVAKYSGGSADFTAGSIVISGILQRVA